MTEKERMKVMKIGRDESELKKLPRTFMSPAYVIEKEPGIFALYRDIMMEEDGHKEKWGKPIGPIFTFRVCKSHEKEDFVTSRADGEVIRLWRIFPPKEEIIP